MPTRGHFDIVQELLKNGARVNTVDTVGLTALDEATRKGHADIVKILIEATTGIISNETVPEGGMFDDMQWQWYAIDETNVYAAFLKRAWGLTADFPYPRRWCFGRS